MSNWQEISVVLVPSSGEVPKDEARAPVRGAGRDASRPASRPHRRRKSSGSRRRVRVSPEPVYRRRRLGALISMCVMLVVAFMPLALTLVPLSKVEERVSGLGSGLQEREVARVRPPLISTAPLAFSPGDDAQAKAPEDKTLYLTVPKLGLYANTVRNNAAPETMDAGAMKIPSTGFPWQEGANTYISAHRVGYRDTESYYQFLNLPSMQKGDEVILADANGKQYLYSVTKVFSVTPDDTWVTKPVKGKDMVTLQTCTETPDDWQTIGPGLMSSGPDTGRLIVRAERV